MSSKIIHDWLVSVGIDPENVMVDSVEAIPERVGWITYKHVDGTYTAFEVSPANLEKLYLSLLEGML